ncbi:lycopene cyclase domain-containing protein [Glutamicibacter uratoxydans]|uniref:lycopene cyclase domain-containing protein n=1 Tax=Glutamicibacter uratoxydans TaxID=43667 RepID=UPI0011421E0B|nr:lycopene cyclase domain-containing protein [Glutamicibacter uratoxydans]
MTYLSILITLIGCMVLIDARGRLFFFHRWARASMCLILGTGLFIVWDAAAIGQGVFLHLDSPLMTGVMVGPQFPVEEVFFLIFLNYSSIISVLGLAEVWSKFNRTTSRSGNQNVS